MATNCPNVSTDAQRYPFGETEVLSASVDMPLRFPGQYFDEETGLHYNYFRDYDPSTGRYIQSDPIGLAGGLNTYGYVGANPLTGVDPLGLYDTNRGGYSVPSPGIPPIYPWDFSAPLLPDFSWNSYSDLPPPGTGSWEDDLNWADNGPKDTTYECKTDDDDHCKKRLIALRNLRRLIVVKKNSGRVTILDEISFNSRANEYHRDCPYWARVPLFNVMGPSNDPLY